MAATSTTLGGTICTLLGSGCVLCVVVCDWLWVSKVVVVTVGGQERERERGREREREREKSGHGKPSFEIVHVIEASNYSIVWVVRKTFICWREFVMVCL